MLPAWPPPPDAEVEPATSPVEMPPVRRPWLVLTGLALPFATIAVGWWIADMAAAGRRDDAWWDAAGHWVDRAVIAALLLAVACCLPVVRRIQQASQVVLALVLGAAYFVLLFLFNLQAYMSTSGPFP